MLLFVNECEDNNGKARMCSERSAPSLIIYIHVVPGSSLNLIISALMSSMQCNRIKLSVACCKSVFAIMGVEGRPI